MKKIALFIVVTLLFLACSKEDDPKSGDKTITKFIFTKANNPSLTEDVEGIIEGNEIKVVLHGLAKTSLKPTITYTSKAINSNEEAKDFTNPVTYTLTAEDGSTTNYTVKVDSRDVFICGMTYINSNYYPVYWKNGNRVDLPLGGKGMGAITEGMIVVDNDVYITGTIYGSSNKAVYWKNGVLTEIAPGAISSSLLDIQLYNRDVYILASIKNADNTIDYAYWKNGVKTVINNIMPNMGLYFMFVNENDIYFGGYVNENKESKAAYWKDGNMIWVSNEPTSLSSLAMVDDNLYAFGKHLQTAVYWKNGIKNTYSFDDNDDIYNGIVIKNDIYMVGNYYKDFKRIAAYWKNGIKTNLSDGTKDTSAPFITSIENDIYIAGDEKSSINSNKYSPIYWINNKKVNIYTDDNCYVASIFVKSN